MFVYRLHSLRRLSSILNKNNSCIESNLNKDGKKSRENTITHAQTQQTKYSKSLATRHSNH